MKNIDVVHSILKSIQSLGVEDIVLCAGARNAPFVFALSEPGPFRVHTFFEERSAGFFALGKMQASGKPVAVITTSGTAAAELLAPTIEADYQGLPLIVVTADRPRRYRGSGAPQTINQIGLYSHYVEKSWDIEGEAPGLINWSGKRPVHLNICFDEPLLDGPFAKLGNCEMREWESSLSASEDLTAPRIQMKKPLIVVSGLPRHEVAAVLHWLKKCRRPLYLESQSQLRGHPELSDFEIRGGESSLNARDYDGVIRVGAVPTVRLWRDLENSPLPVVNFSHLPFSGLPRERGVFPLSALSSCSTDFEPWTVSESQWDAERAIRAEILCKEFSLSELAWVRWISEQMPTQARVFIGNSLPIREWDFAALRSGGREIFTNRGVNGIDGLISTFLGVASTTQSNWGIIGDLSALYDLSGPWAARMGEISDLNLVIINNGGGKIFNRLFRNPLFENSHQMNFKSWAEMWGWDYLRMDRPQELAAAEKPRVIEIVPSNEQTQEFWRAWEKN